MNNNYKYLIICAVKILKHRIEIAHSAQSKSALIFAHNLLIYVLNNDEKKINELMEKEGLVK